MSSSLTIKLDNQKLNQVRLVLIGVKDGYPKAVRRSTNRAVGAAKTTMGKETREVLNLLQTRINKNIEVKKMTASDPTAYVKSRGEPVGLINFAIRQTIVGQKTLKQTYEGIPVKVLRRGKTKTVPSAFIGSGRGGAEKQHIFRRRKPPYKVKIEDMPENYIRYFARRKKDKRRLPIDRLTGPRVEDVIAKPEVMKKIEARASEVFDKAIGAETKYILSKL